MISELKRGRIILILILTIGIGLIAYRVYQDEKAREAKRIDMIGAVDPATLVASKKPVTKLQIGVTYIAYSKKEWGDYVWNYIKVLPNKRILSIEDQAHHPRSFYYRKLEDGDDDAKWLTIDESDYEVKGKNYFATSGIETRLIFDVRENVKKGSHGDYAYKQRWWGAGALEFKNGHYRDNTVRLDGYPGDLYKAKAQLPNSLDEYVSQYKLASEPPVISGEDGS
ncbi:MAG: hypothetical protein ABF743_11165 [Schleiferilactobacillus perolens]|uniref:hypothetical protein n=1 Tax=Schleiferilactobacillus perolens TaxID=100468 RepID=UPI0039ED59CD